jgi:hypothetical protein
LGPSPEACFVLIFAIYQAPKREAFVCRDAPSRFAGDRRSRQLAAGSQTKGADIHSVSGKPCSKGIEFEGIGNGFFRGKTGFKRIVIQRAKG